MALFLKQEDNRSELQSKIAAELQVRARAKAKEAERPDGVADSAYIKGTKQTTSLAWVWAVIGFVVLGLVIWLVVATSSR